MDPCYSVKIQAGSNSIFELHEYSPSSRADESKSEKYDKNQEKNQLNRELLNRVAVKVKQGIESGSPRDRELFYERISMLGDFFEINKSEILAFLDSVKDKSSHSNAEQRKSAEERAVMATASAIRQFAILGRGGGPALLGGTIPEFRIPKPYY